MSSDALQKVLKDTIKESAEAAAKKGITQATEDALQKSLQDTLRNSAIDGFQKQIKEAIEKNLDVNDALTKASKDIKTKIKSPDTFSNFSDTVFNKLDANLKKIANSNPTVFKDTLTKSIDEVDYSSTFRSYADKPKMGKLSFGADADFKVKDQNVANDIKKGSNDIQKSLDADPEYKQKSVAERQADFEDLKNGKKQSELGDGTSNPANDPKIKQGVKGQGRGLFKATAKAGAVAIAGITLFAWANKRANDINNWKGNCEKIEKTSDNKLIFSTLNGFPEEDPTGCSGREFRIEFSNSPISFSGGPSNIPTINSGCNGKTLPGIEKGDDLKKFKYTLSNCPQCLIDAFSSALPGIYNVTPNSAIILRCKTTVATETGCIIKEYGLEPLDDLFGGLGINFGKIIRTILIVIGVVILAIVIFKVIGFIKNRD